ncbi:hypothetical protein HK102_009094 [Quaeritorhiza haematococci]|nr:hypothetical protein HK102_009094 [Quaeritorhiza haematococci]
MFILQHRYAGVEDNADVDHEGPKLGKLRQGDAGFVTHFIQRMCGEEATRDRVGPMGRSRGDDENGTGGDQEMRRVRRGVREFECLDARGVGVDLGRRGVADANSNVGVQVDDHTSLEAIVTSNPLNGETNTPEEGESARTHTIPFSTIPATRTDSASDHLLPHRLPRLTPISINDIDLEWGNILSDGRGLCITSDSIVWRNAAKRLAEGWVTSMSDDAYGGEGDWVNALRGAEMRIREVFRTWIGCEVVILPSLVDGGTAHVDMYIALPTPNHILVGAYDEDEDPVNAKIMQENFNILRQYFDNATVLPMPTSCPVPGLAPNSMPNSSAAAHHRAGPGHTPSTNSTSHPMHGEEFDAETVRFLQAMPRCPYFLLNTAEQQAQKQDHRVINEEGGEAREQAEHDLEVALLTTDRTALTFRTYANALMLNRDVLVPLYRDITESPHCVGFDRQATISNSTGAAGSGGSSRDRYQNWKILRTFCEREQRKEAQALQIWRDAVGGEVGTEVGRQAEMGSGAGENEEIRNEKGELESKRKARRVIPVTATDRLIRMQGNLHCISSTVPQVPS